MRHKTQIWPKSDRHCHVFLVFSLKKNIFVWSFELYSENRPLPLPLASLSRFGGSGFLNLWGCAVRGPGRSGQHRWMVDDFTFFWIIFWLFQFAAILDYVLVINVITFRFVLVFVPVKTLGGGKEGGFLVLFKSVGNVSKKRSGAFGGRILGTKNWAGSSCWRLRWNGIWMDHSLSLKLLSSALDCLVLSFFFEALLRKSYAKWVFFFLKGFKPPSRLGVSVALVDVTLQSVRNY